REDRPNRRQAWTIGSDTPAMAGSASASPELGGAGFALHSPCTTSRGLDGVCDGCTSPAEWLVALQAGCWRAQGGYIGPPLAAEDVTAWLHTWEGVR
ncbi:MAG: hypothetical protein M3071_17120, partial [Actinomycetota bacterium]|nr:hypothetical protein [Actinomycetota bacterium]